MFISAIAQVIFGLLIYYPGETGEKATLLLKYQQRYLWYNAITNKTDIQHVKGCSIINKSKKRKTKKRKLTLQLISVNKEAV